MAHLLNHKKKTKTETKPLWHSSNYHVQLHVRQSENPLPGSPTAAESLGMPLLCLYLCYHQLKGNHLSFWECLRLFVILLQLFVWFFCSSLSFSPQVCIFYWWSSLFFSLLSAYHCTLSASSCKPNDFCLDVKRIWEMTATLTSRPRLSGRKGSCVLSLEYDGLERVALLMLRFNM